MSSLPGSFACAGVVWNMLCGIRDAGIRNLARIVGIQIPPTWAK
jgi:hypothetical protein